MAVEEEAQLELEKNPSPKDEAKDFQNVDERIQAANYAHKIALIAAKKGIIGKITGSTNESMNTGTFILICCLTLLIAAGIGMVFKPEIFSSLADNLLKIILAVIGYIFGTHRAQEKE